VQVKVTGSLRTLEAITDDQETIATGSLVKVVGTENNLLLVTSK
jgi:hypothetical protein